MTKQIITEETFTLNALCLAYELPPYSVRERKGRSKSKLYNVYIDDSLIFYGTIHQVKYYLMNAIYLITRVEERHVEEMKKSWSGMERTKPPVLSNQGCR